MKYLHSCLLNVLKYIAYRGVMLSVRAALFLQYLYRMTEHKGYSLVEILVVIAIVVTLGAIATPVVATYHANCSMKIAVCEICEMIKEARALALAANNPVAVTFAPSSTAVSLVADRGADGKWNTTDDTLIRSFKLFNKSGIRFGYGACGPVPGLANEADGITFQTNNSMVCNQEMSSNAGTVYLIVNDSRVTALTVNSVDSKITIRECRGGQW
jgi:prepilin-type N-terminal cleavage/methylation domain-containing protein